MDEAAEPLSWAVVANVAERTAHGKGGREVRRGLKHFAPGAKLWVLPPQWGDGGEQVVVVGRHRGAYTRYVHMVVRSRHLTNFRVRAVYSPTLHRALSTAGWRQWESQQHAEGWAEQWRRDVGNF